jgi:uncharacterized membrane protein
MTDDRRAPTRYERTNPGLEFDRVAFFSDAVYAIAMTLLVVGIGVPHVRDANLGSALAHLDSEIISFFIGFFVLAYYWLSHHALVAQLRAVNPFFLAINLLYLAVVAFLPFPTALVGTNGDAPLAFILFACSLAAVSILEVALYLCAHRFDLLRNPPDRERAPSRHHRRVDPRARVPALDPDRLPRHDRGVFLVAHRPPGRAAARPVHAGDRRDRGAHGTARLNEARQSSSVIVSTADPALTCAWSASPTSIRNRSVGSGR